MKRRTLLRAAVAAAVSLPFTFSASAQSWPNKAIKWVNPFPAGGGTDVFARPMAAKIGTALGQSVYIENLGGAAGTLGAGVAAKAVPDGYTFFVGAIHHAIAESLYLKRGYKLEEDFVPITVFAFVPNVLVVHPKLGIKTVEEFVKYAKANPGKLNYGSAGSGASRASNGHRLPTLRHRPRQRRDRAPPRAPGPTRRRCGYSWNRMRGSSAA